MEEDVPFDPETGAEGVLPNADSKPTTPAEVFSPKDSRPSSPGDGSNSGDSLGKVNYL